MNQNAVLLAAVPVTGFIFVRIFVIVIVLLSALALFAGLG